ncbi:MAG: N,N'-diacetyllegionaminate synthase [Parvicellaceae bacterium]|jgi:N,N'-diacetyllegionaminate synthase
MFDKEIVIGLTKISNDSAVYVIAEAGVNHGGDIEVAKKLVDVAVDAKVDAVKFQAFRTEHLIVEGVEKAPYQQNTTGNTESQADMLRGLELRYEHYKELKDYCDSKGVHFLITPFDEVSLHELEKLGVLGYKIASTDTTNLPFIKKVAETGKPIILSTGMCDLNEVDAAVKEIEKSNNQLILLQCTANYPIKDNEVNLAVIPEYANRYKCIVGYSDHTVGIGAAPFAIPYGAKVVEKHFTLNKDEDGPDHRASLDPKELAEFVTIVRRAEQFHGSSIKLPTASELQTKQSLQKCLVAAENILEGETFSLENMVAKRTGGHGISPIKYEQIIGKKASKNFQKNEIISID